MKTKKQVNESNLCAFTLDKAMSPIVSPLSWKPKTPDDLVGQSREIAKKLIAKAHAVKNHGCAPIKVLLYGAPGVGKTTLAEMLARELTDCNWGIEDVNGKTVTIEVAKQWMMQLPYGNMFSDWTVKIVNELDRCSRDAQDLLLSYLDKMPERRAFIGTSNLELQNLTERFQTRFQAIKLQAPTSDEIRGFLLQRWDIPEQVAAMIAVGSGGCVRAALADLENYLDAKR